MPSAESPRRPLRARVHCFASPSLPGRCPRRAGPARAKAAAGGQGPAGAGRGVPGARREMKYLKPWWSDGGGLLHLTILLSLAGLRLDLDLDLYLLLPPPTLLWDELLLAGCPTSSAYALSPFLASGGWGRADQLHPKGREPDPAAEPEGRLLREVRALGVPFIPRTRVDAWLVHSVTAGDADGAHGLLGAAASSAGGVGASVDDSSPAAPGDGGDPRAAASSPLAAGEEEKAPAEPTAQVLDAGGRANQVRRAGTRARCWGSWPGALRACAGPREGAHPLCLHPQPLGGCSFGTTLAASFCECKRKLLVRSLWLLGV